ncbi:hypothetical protein DVS28_b0164 (plasmid) [Euzebya pacifica]|uniref:DUF7715 domain-containing protein n=1 Tax=Euzebya pacifica TaxID=1608957 RepID=A0A346Y637_9ACTN|nr:hypothetical protein [Euzebya pacifica]AXV09934.1 hypothetical protein DVS28_b0164 [Euzebya pacifica]
MKILVATAKGQGIRTSDYHFATEGEHVVFASECDRRESIDGRCGCKRGLAGTTSRKVTTTALVIDADIDRQDYIDGIVAAQAEAWADLIPTEELVEEAEEMLRIADCFPVGAVVEKRGTSIKMRDPRAVTATSA